MLHGECVSIGCVWEAELAVRMGHLEAAHVPVIRRCFEQLGTPDPADLWFCVGSSARNL